MPDVVQSKQMFTLCSDRLLHTHITIVFPFLFVCFFNEFLFIQCRKDVKRNGVSLCQQSPAASHLEEHSHTGAAQDDQTLYDHWSSGGFGALFKDTWTLSRYICGWGGLSVCEYITSGFCCFSIGGMEITLTVKVSQSLKLCSTSDRVFSYTVFLVNTWLS